MRCYCVVDSFAHVLFVSGPTAPTSCAGSAAGPTGPEDRNNERILKCRPRTARRRNARGAVRARKRPPTTMVSTACTITVCSERGLIKCALSKTKKCNICILAAKDFAGNVSATNPAHLLSFTLDKRRTKLSDVCYTTGRKMVCSLYCDW